MVTQTDLSLNGHNLSGSVNYIHGFLNTKNGSKFLLNGCEEIRMNQNDKILKIKVMYMKNKRQYSPISLQMHLSFQDPSFIGIDASSVEIFNSTETTKTQTININHIFNSCCSIYFELNLRMKDEKLLMLIEYRMP